MGFRLLKSADNSDLCALQVLSFSLGCDRIPTFQSSCCLHLPGQFSKKMGQQVAWPWLVIMVLCLNVWCFLQRIFVSVIQGKVTKFPDPLLIRPECIHSYSSRLCRGLHVQDSNSSNWIVIITEYEVFTCHYIMGTWARWIHPISLRSVIILSSRVHLNRTAVAAQSV
jgi:hypothetical protein